MERLIFCTFGDDVFAAYEAALQASR